MKKIIFIAILFFSLQNYDQKTFEVYNLTGQTVKLWDIITKPNSSATYPEFHSRPFWSVTIPPGGYYALENTSNIFKFPFESPASIPYISNWERLNSSSSTTAFTSPVAWSLSTSNSQVFTSLIFEVGTSWNNFTTIPPVPIVAYSAPTYSSLSGSSWILDYDCTNPSPNVWHYTIVIY